MLATYESDSDEAAAPEDDASDASEDVAEPGLTAETVADTGEAEAELEAEGGESEAGEADDVAVDAEEDELDEEEDEEEDGGSGDDSAPSGGRALPSASQAFSMVDQKELEKFKPKKEFVVKSFKRQAMRREAPAAPPTVAKAKGKVAAKAQVGTVSAGPMMAGLRPTPREVASAKGEVDYVDEQLKIAAIQAMGLDDGHGGEDGSKGKGKGKGGKGATHPRDEGEGPDEAVLLLEDEQRLKRARKGFAAADSAGPAEVGTKRLPKGHILGLAQDEMKRQREQHMALT